MYGELVPIGGGDPIPLLKESLLVGRREDCDIVLRFSNVSGHHCKLTLLSGYWFVKDLGSRNGVKVNDRKVQEKRLDPGDKLSFAKQEFQLQYSPEALGAIGTPPHDPEAYTEIFRTSLLESAGLVKPKRPSSN